MSFSVNVASRTYSFAEQHPTIAAHPVRIGWGEMQRRTTEPFVDVWWRFYVNDGPGMTVHGPGGDVTIPAQRLAILPAWITWQLSCRRKLKHLFVEVECPDISTQQVQQSCNAAYVIDKSAGQLFINSVQTILQQRSHPGIGNLVCAGVHQAMASIAQYFSTLPLNNALITEILSYIDEHIAYDLRIPELALRFNCSQKHITNLFNYYLNQSPAAYIRERRLTKACNLLRETQLSIEHVAEQSGFANRAYFSRVMRQDMNIPPATYRKRNAPQ